VYISFFLNSLFLYNYILKFIYITILLILYLLNNLKGFDYSFLPLIKRSKIKYFSLKIKRKPIICVGTINGFKGS